jgi:hypothetical protein
MKKQSSIEWLISEIKRHNDAGYEFNPKHNEEIIEQAKELHKQEIELAHLHNRCLQDQTYECSIKAIDNAEKYYKDIFETFKSE